MLLFLMGHCLLFRATTIYRRHCRAENERAQRVCPRDRDKEERETRKKLRWQGSGDWGVFTKVSEGAMKSVCKILGTLHEPGGIVA
ncbi:MAG: hypothetical protein BYD32DRAFT_414151 [Podila humilis]|nr:MAG: hypothetical protein BYD32DRAFT_414151 [Podila humilis]